MTAWGYECYLVVMISLTSERTVLCEQQNNRNRLGLFIYISQNKMRIVFVRHKKGVGGGGVEALLYLHHIKLTTVGSKLHRVIIIIIIITFSIGDSMSCSSVWK